MGASPVFIPMHGRDAHATKEAAPRAPRHGWCRDTYPGGSLKRADRADGVSGFGGADGVSGQGADLNPGI